MSSVRALRQVLWEAAAGRIQCDNRVVRSVPPNEMKSRDCAGIRDEVYKMKYHSSFGKGDREARRANRPRRHFRSEATVDGGAAVFKPRNGAQLPEISSRKVPRHLVAKLLSIMRHKAVQLLTWTDFR